MSAKAYLARLRSTNGPSHQLLVLLDKHRVMSTIQIHRATGAPERTVRYRMEQLGKHGLVGWTRPGLEAGSSPRYWWLKPAGARIVTGTALAEGHPKPTTILHGAAITEVWLALRDHGPQHGIRVLDWRTDRAGWQEWETSGGYHGLNSRRLTPDALCRLAIDTEAGPVELTVCIEVDLASMTQTQMRQKLSHYLAFHADRAWEDAGFGSCPPMLLFTSTASRAINFMRISSKQLAAQPPPGRWSIFDTDTADIDKADELMVAACGLVHQPSEAVGGLCWTLPDPHAAEVTLAEILTARARVQARAEQARDRVHEQQQRQKAAETLENLGQMHNRYGNKHTIADLDFKLRAMYQLLVPRHRGGLRLLDEHPQLAAAILDWDANPSKDNADRARTALIEHHRRLWITDAHAVLAAHELIEAADPDLIGLTETLGQRRLLTSRQRDWLGDPRHADHTHEQLQAESLTGYEEYRDHLAETRYRHLNWRARRRTSLDQIADAIDEDTLFACPRCGILKWSNPVDPHAEYEAGRCRACGAEPIDPVGYGDRHQIPTLTQRLDTLRQQLADAESGQPWQPANTPY